ncbi:MULTISPECIES: toxin-antitoxin system HicB family antitoxin [Acinetobacter]|uniref:toxin-antitoxin system HicB family antitoxin n=1 Tax=Acinetobacter TaxID=469 RepID=UPI0015B8A63F|nr:MULTISPECIES: toxin-antitoxin system HicB family antitoxin [Acinetobacter]NWK82584.1 toxin-antitoxin system HicB family antitoxin [Acinetobacter sp. SwsAc4]
MSSLTIRLPDDKHQRLKALAASRHISINKLIDELATIALVEYDAKTRFITRSQKATAQDGLELLDLLDQKDQS